MQFAGYFAGSPCRLSRVCDACGQGRGRSLDSLMMAMVLIMEVPLIPMMISLN